MNVSAMSEMRKKQIKQIKGVIDYDRFLVGSNGGDPNSIPVVKLPEFIEPPAE
jgi:hypothetical protein